jgi:hypothetical protein
MTRDYNEGFAAGCLEQEGYEAELRRLHVEAESLRTGLTFALTREQDAIKQAQRLLAERDELKAEAERLRAERDYSRACLERASALIHGIHALLYPPHVTLSDGRTMAFRPSSLDPHEVLQELSNRIRALPDKLDALVVAAEREACAQIVDHILKEGGGTYGDAIRARGEK